MLGKAVTLPNDYLYRWELGKAKGAGVPWRDLYLIHNRLKLTHEGALCISKKYHFFTVHTILSELYNTLCGAFKAAHQKYNPNNLIMSPQK